MKKIGLLAVICIFLVSCAKTPVKEAAVFQLNQESPLYKQLNWRFEGRLALSNAMDSLIVSIQWQHTPQFDEMEFSGPFGIGRALLSVRGQEIIIEKGGERLKYYGELETVISEHLKMDIPFQLLNYWVLGLIHPKKSYQLLADGFLQSHWQVRYQKMQLIGEYFLPRKLSIKKADKRLKLIINHWELDL